MKGLRINKLFIVALIASCFRAIPLCLLRFPRSFVCTCGASTTIENNGRKNRNYILYIDRVVGHVIERPKTHSEDTL